MLKFYLTTVAIYAIIILSMCKMFKSAINENGWFKDEEKETGENKWTMLFCLSAVPIIRLLIVISIYMIAMHGPDDDFWKKND